MSSPGPARGGGTRPGVDGGRASESSAEGIAVNFGLFRFVAVAEACSWAGLLVGMFFKYIVAAGELGVKVFGPIHGALFILYVVAVLVAARAQGWLTGTVVLGLACGVPPFASVWFERRMARRAVVVDAAPEPVTDRL